MALPEINPPALIDKYALVHFEKHFEIDDRKELLTRFHAGECRCCEDERDSIRASCPYFYPRIENIAAAWEHNDEEIWEDVLNFQTECTMRRPPLDTADADVLLSALCKQAELTLVTTQSAGDGTVSRPEIAGVFGVKHVVVG